MVDQLDLEVIRKQFAALRAQPDRPAPVHADAPGGTQVPECVIAAMGAYLREANANAHGAFASSRATDALVQDCRLKAAAFFGTEDTGEVVIGPNMTSLTFALSRALACSWEPGDEIVVTSLDHDANVQPWLRAASDRGCTAHRLGFDADGDLPVAGLRELLGERTKLVACTLASNALGTLVDAAPLIAAAHEVGAAVFLDAVHFAPHRLPDVAALDCDFLVCSPYKFCGPHQGLLYGKRAWLERLPAYKVRPAADTVPERWETGTPNFEAIAGCAAQLDYLARLTDAGASATDRAALQRSYAAIAAHETALGRRFLAGVADLPGFSVYGVTDPERLDRRTPTFGCTLVGRRPVDLAQQLAERDIYAWAGHFYAIGVTAQLGLDETGGLLRLGFAHYHTPADVDRVVAALHEIADA